MAAIQMRAYHQQMDEPRLLALWPEAFGSAWPLEAGWLRELIAPPQVYLPGDHIIAEQHGELLGFAFTQLDALHPQNGSILALAVHPRCQMQGLGRRLYRAALARLRSRGARWVQLGSGARSYFWPGVPASLPQAWAFFSSLGWQKAGASFDLVRALPDYHTPAWVWERVRDLDLRFEQASAQDAAAVLAFVAHQHAPWAPFFAQAFDQHCHGDVILARAAAHGAIVAACLAQENSARWAGCFPGPVGAPGCILTAERARGQGIGMALAARATELLKARGCLSSFLGWTWLVDWYGKLGYTIWQEYIIGAAREISPMLLEDA